MADPSLVLLIFSAEWCAPCKALKKDTLDSKSFLEGGGALRVTEVDIDADEKTAGAFAVNAVPTLVLLTADNKIVSRRSGYMESVELLAWIEEGRRRAKAGQWEGTAPGSKLDGLIAKAAGAGLDPNDLKQLIEWLGEPDPGERAGVAKLLLAQREQAIPPLIDAVADTYLGVRIGASELLHRLAPDVASVDPWQSPLELSNMVVTLKNWWSETGKLPPVSAPRVVDPSVAGSIKAALEDLRGDDPVRRTEAMSTLVGHGPVALPAVREAIKRSERSDPRAVGLLEDVRWAILIPDSVERRATGVRSALARGASPERQAAAAKLGRGGREALDALAELANDADPLVVESAVRALSSIGGKDVIPAMAALLKASDSNLRMTAAQALGRTKSAEATRHLLTVLDDPNEVVACAALAALDEVNAKDSPFNPAPGAKDALGAETIAALKKALADSRWRVRAAAVEVTGKLKVTELVPEVKKLMDDSDGFVVKNTLVALNGMSSAPDAERLIALARRLPSLRGDAVAMLARSASEDAVKAVTELYDNGSTESRVTILNALGLREKFDRSPVDDIWKPLLSKAISAPEPRLRRAAASLLGLSSLALAGELIGPLLAEEDAETHTAAAEVVLGVLAGRRSALFRSDVYGGIEMDEEMVFSGSSRSRTSKTNKVHVTPERLAMWHSNLLQHAGSDIRNVLGGFLTEALSPSVAAAVFATGDGKADLPLLAEALAKADTTAIKRLAASPALAVVIPKLPWPEGQAVLDELSAAPSLFVLAVVENEKATPEAANYLLEPARFKAAVEAASGDEQTAALQRLLNDSSYGQRKPWSLLRPGERTQNIMAALLDSTNAAWRAAAVYVSGRVAPEKHTAVFEKALKDSSPWVRATGVQGLTRTSIERPVLEDRVGALLADKHAHVREIAALALLESELRAAAGLQFQFSAFQFEEIHASSSDSVSMNPDRPLTTLATKPPYLQEARRHLAATNDLQKATFALLLAQHGEFEGVDRLVATQPERGVERFSSLPDALLAGIALSRDSKYLPFLRKLMEQTQQEWELRKILRALKGMTGAEVRQMRLELNKRMRTAGSASTMAE